MNLVAGIGFELRKLFKEEGIVHNIKAYAYSSMTTIGPMVLCIVLVLALQKMMKAYNFVYLEWELFIATVTYSFVFSIILTSGLSMVLTRYIADMVYQKKYENIISSFYGALVIILPICAVICLVFLSGVSESLGYKVSAYLFFMELVIIWIQAVYLSALKDYLRIVRSFAIGVAVTLLIGWLLFYFTTIQQTIIALMACNVGFGIIVAMTMFHFEHVFPRNEKRNYFAFLQYFKKYPSIFFAGMFVYSGVYVHNFIYWISSDALVISNRFKLMPFYDLPVFYAYLSVVPSLVIFVVSVETSFYEKFRVYYLNISNDGTYKSMNQAKKEMQKALLKGISFLIEVQLLFTVLAIAFGLMWLPKVGFTMDQLDLFIMLALGFFFFIIMFVLIHALMYFDDRKGVFLISGLFVIINGVATYLTMNLTMNGLGMFIASVLVLVIALLRLLHVLWNIDYYTYCSQPLGSQSKQKKWKVPFLKPVTMFVLLVSASIVLAACSNEPEKPKEQDGIAEEVVTPSKIDGQLVEDKRLYDRDEDDSVKSLYITVLPKKDEKNDQVDWYGLNRMTDRYSEENLKIIIAEGTEDGAGPKPGMFGHGADASNAKISLRGNTARYAAQKSYKIKLFDETGLWQGQRTINLNKHISDFSRLRNKLSFDLMEQIPDMTSLRTQFVRLYVKDLTAVNPQSSYEDYGLYTHIEQPNEMFLKSHWLDPYGYLYKVSFFEFHRYPDQIKSISDPTYDKSDFETILEIKGREEHDKLIAMLDDVNNIQLPIDDVMEKHFDLDNFLTWTAMNILMDNMDTDANNFYLYSPLNSEKWYILPWDYDGAWELQREKNSIRPHQAGISNFWGSMLHNRYFRTEEHVQLLVDKVEELSTYINAQTVEDQLNKYAEVVEPFLFRAPDKHFLTEINTEYGTELQQIIDTPKRSVQRFLEDIKKPKPFFMNYVVDDGENLTLSWQISYDLQGDDLYYDITIANDPLLTQVIEKKENMQVNEFQMKKPKVGYYYWKVIVRDSEGNEQQSFEMYTDEEGDNYFGIRQFEVD